jgi:hypothetical protein
MKSGETGGGAAMNEIERIVERVLSGDKVSMMSCSEQIVAALLFNRMDWLPPAYQHPLDAMSRLGADWLRMVLEHHKNHPL